MNEQEREIPRDLRVLRHVELSVKICQICRLFAPVRSTFNSWKVEYDKFGDAGLTRNPPTARDHPRAIPSEIVLHLRRT